MKIYVFGTRGFPGIQGGVENIVNNCTLIFLKTFK